MGAPNKNFDKELRMKKGSEQYRLDKVKAGRCGSSAGKPRPYAKKNMLLARLNSPLMVGNTIYVTPKRNFAGMRVGYLYKWVVEEEGFGQIDGKPFEAREIVDNFMVIPKGKVI